MQDGNMLGSLMALASDIAGGLQVPLADVFRQLPGAAAIVEAPSGRLLMRSAHSVQVLGHDPFTQGHLAHLTQYGGVHADGRAYAPGDYPIMRALHQGEVVDGEILFYRRPDGRMVNLSVHAGPVRAADGRIVAAVGIAFDATERLQAEQQLREALAAREVLMREADHRIRNSLQLVVSLLSLQHSKAADAQIKTALADAMARVDAIANAHLALQRSADLRAIEIDSMMADLCARLGALNPAVTLACAAQSGLVLPVDTAIPLGLIASEVLTNALRHAFAPGAAGRIALNLQAQAGCLEMVIEDSGCGLPDAAGRVGLGSAVIATLARQIGAHMRTSSAPGQGVVVALRLELGGLR